MNSNIYPLPVLKNNSQNVRSTPDHVRAEFSKSEKYFPTTIQLFQFLEKYSRFSYEHNRRETWEETVKRATDFLRELSSNKIPESIYKKIEEYILTMKVMPSMRLLAMAGEAARRNNISIYNCSYIVVDSLDAFSEALLIGMNGCGVGYSVEKRYVEKLPRITQQKGSPKEVYLIPDTTEGWVEALRKGLNAWFNGNDIEFDYSLIRPAGAPLRVKGGRASGPKPLKDMLDFVRKKILDRQGSFLRPIDAHDIMCVIGNASISGGVRRTALISLFDFDDEEMLLCKSPANIVGNEQRWNANNSAVWPERELTQQEVAKFMLTMFEGQVGEPGIFSRRAAKEMAPARREKRDFGTNPSLRRGTRVITDLGFLPIEELEGKKFKVINLNGEISNAECFLSGKNKQLYKITLSGGFEYYCTAEHKWPVLKTDNNLFEKKEASALKIGDKLPVNLVKKFFGTFGNKSDGLFMGLLYGSGLITQNLNVSNNKIDLIFSNQTLISDFVKTINEKASQIDPEAKLTQKANDSILSINVQKLESFIQSFGSFIGTKRLPEKIWNDGSIDFVSGFIEGLLLSTGEINDGMVTLKTAQKTLAQELLELLGACGIFANMEKSSKFAGKNLEIYDIQFSKEMLDKIRDKNQDNLSKQKKPQMLRTVVNIEKTNLFEDVWDISVYDEDTHCFALSGAITGNCGEIVLRPNQFCNLSAAVAREDDTYETLKDKVEVATIIGTIQSMATHFPGLRNIWKENSEEERLLGVDINGQMDSPVARDPDVQEKLKNVVIEVNKKYAALLGINQSAAATCVKPSGNSSILLNSSSGIHARWSRYYIRNIRISAYSPLYKVMKDAGVPMTPENGQTEENATTWVIPFPIKSPDDAIFKNDRSAIEQANYWLQVKTHWTEHNPSCTITYKPDEVIDLIKWVWEHQNMIGGLSFLPAFDAQYEQMPYVEITKDEYEKRVKSFPKIDFSEIYKYETEDLTTAAQELACFAGTCEL